MDFSQYLEQLPPDKRDKLYDSVWTVQAVFRSLQPLAKAYLLRLLPIEVPFPQDYAASWVKKRYHAAHAGAMQQLQHLSILQATTLNTQPSWVVHPSFRKQLNWAISRGAEAAGEQSAEVQQAAPSSEELDAFASGQWEQLQLHLLNADSPTPRMPDAMQGEEPLALRRMLRSAGLLAEATDAVSERGFQFLLQSTEKQLWAVLHEYIKDAEAKAGSQLSGVMSFLMQLGFRRVGQALAVSALSVWERTIAAHMMQLGLLYPFQVADSVYFSPTRLASSLCGGGGASAGSAASASGAAEVATGHIIVESNYRVYAYTSSPVQIAILELFCRKECLLPNFFVGVINKESVGKALASGIGAEEIILYLQQHPHINVASKTPIVPEVVSDQIRLWEADTYRVRMDAAVLYSAFESPDLYQKTLAYARSRGYVLWVGAAASEFAARESAHEDLRNYIKQLKAL